MECNKDEALRAKEIAETKLTQKDIVGAQKFAVKAQNLFPGLEGLSQLVATLDVYASAEKRINGEVDWYGILGVDPSADDEMIRKNYRKLALTLHPDKNKSTGADGAFKIVSEAWSLLSDKARKTAYDQKRNLRNTYEKVVIQKPSMPASKNGFHSSVVNRQKTSNPQPTPVYPRPSKPNTFWTSCARCLMHYEYLRTYLNQRLLCPNCQQPFLAVEMPVPPGNRNAPTGWPPHVQHQFPNHHVANNSAHAVGGVGATSNVTVQRGPLSKSGTGSSVKLKRGREAETVAGREGPLQTKRKADGSAKKRRVDEHKWNNNRNDSIHQMATGHGASVYVNGKGSAGGDRVLFPGSSRPNSTRELSQSETRIMLMTKARREIVKKLDEWNLASQNERRGVERENADASIIDMKKPSVSGMRKEGDMNRSSVNIKNLVQPKQSSRPAVIIDSVVEPAETISMSVPDPDFHDFDQDRTEKSFGENQVWAAYDDDDGMPRFYALIHSVISKKPFKMQISWLNSKSNAELGPINWVGSGFPKTSGDFRVGKHEVNHTLNAFSHKVKWTKGKRGVIQIFPAKGDVWALYRNWSPDWNEHTPDELIHNYEMVEVLEDYTEEQGVTVTPLVKVAGFKSVFHQNLDLKEGRKIPREEMFRFSHQVPSYSMTGQEAQNVPKGCRELDPAAMPSELLQVITEAQSVENVENAKEELHVLENSKKTEGKGVITYARKTVGRNAKEIKGKEGVESTNQAKE